MYVCVFKDGDVFTMGGGGEKDKERLRMTSGVGYSSPSLLLGLHRTLAPLLWLFG